MLLPDNAVGPTDTIKYLECPRRFAHGLKRHELGRDLGEDGMTATYPATVYGTAFHDAVQAIEEDILTDEEAVAIVIGKYGRWLDPADRTRLLDDLALYHRRDPKGVETLLNEGELRIPLMVHNGVQIWFRGKIDRLYRRPGTHHLIHRDYKTSRWAKSEADVHNDKQMWAYNMAIYEWYEREFLVRPDSLQQTYDQLRYGEVPTRKNDEQRAEMRAWLCDVVTTMLDDEKLEHRYNEWCPYCPILSDCPVVEELSEYALSRIAVLAPSRPKLKQNGEPGKQTITELDPVHFDEAIGQLPRVKDALKVLKKFDELATTELKTMPEEDRQAYGYALQPQQRDHWSEDARAEIIEDHPDLAPLIVNVTKTAVERELKDDKPRLEYVLSLAEKKEIDPSLVRVE